MRTTRPIILSVALSLTVVLFHGAASAQTPASPYPGSYYSPGGYSGGYYFQPGYYPNPVTRVAPPAPVYYTPASRYISTPARHSSFISHDDWSTGRSNYPVPLTKPWMSPNHY